MCGKKCQLAFWMHYFAFKLTQTPPAEANFSHVHMWGQNRPLMCWICRHFTRLNELAQPMVTEFKNLNDFTILRDIWGKWINFVVVFCFVFLWGFFGFFVVAVFFFFFTKMSEWKTCWRGVFPQICVLCRKGLIHSPPALIYLLILLIICAVYFMTTTQIPGECYFTI